MKNNSQFVETLNAVDRRMQEARKQSDLIRIACNAGDRMTAHELALQLEDRAERMLLLCRALPLYTGHPKARDAVEEIIDKNIPVQIGFTEEGWFCVRIPLLLPKKKKGSVDYIRGFLYRAMHRFFCGKDPVRYNKCVLIYRHVYSRDRPERQWRDHDNIEINLVTDIVALYVMPDDGPKVCCHYYCSAAGSEERTEVYVVSREDFHAWLETEKTMPEEGVTLYENRRIRQNRPM